MFLLRDDAVLRPRLEPRQDGVVVGPPVPFGQRTGGKGKREKAPCRRGARTEVHVVVTYVFERIVVKQCVQSMGLLFQIEFFGTSCSPRPADEWKIVEPRVNSNVPRGLQGVEKPQVAERTPAYYAATCFVMY